MRLALGVEDAIEEYKSSFSNLRTSNDANLENSDLDEAELDKESQTAFVFKQKCKWAFGYIDDLTSNLPKEQKEESELKIWKLINDGVLLADSCKNEFNKSAILHDVTILLSAIGEYDRAREIIPMIVVDFIKAEAVSFLEQSISNSKA